MLSTHTRAFLASFLTYVAGIVQAGLALFMLYGPMFGSNCRGTSSGNGPMTMTCESWRSTMEIGMAPLQVVPVMILIVLSVAAVVANYTHSEIIGVFRRAVVYMSIIATATNLMTFGILFVPCGAVMLAAALFGIHIDEPRAGPSGQRVRI
jgi:hypothetical protein